MKKRGHYFLGNIVEKEFNSTFFVIGIFLFTYILFFRLYYPVISPTSYDEVNFSLAILEFNMQLMQPHFPGYPFFILGGMIIDHFIHNPTMALSYFNILMSIVSSIPIYLIAKEYVSKSNSLLVVLFMQTIPFLNILFTQPMSEGAAIAVLYWFIWSLIKASKRNSQVLGLLPNFIFSLLLGIRLSYIVFGIGLVWLWIMKIKQDGLKESIIPIIIQIITAFLFQLIWINALIFSEGGVNSFLTTALSFTGGHFNEWGGSIVTENSSFLERFFQLIVINFLWVGMFGANLIVGIFVTILVFFTKRRPIFVFPYQSLFLLLTASYFLWALFAQNVDKPRHIAPLVALCSLVLIINFLLVKTNTTFTLLKVLFLVNLTLSSFYIFEQAHETPAIHQLADFLESEQGDFICYTWNESRVFEYLNVPFTYEEVQTYDYFLQKLQGDNHPTIFVTNHVIDGFIKQGIDVNGKIEYVETFQSNKLFEPVYHSIDLYKWKRQ